MSKPYEIIEYDGQPARRYKDGSIRDDRGRMLSRPPILEETGIRTSEDGRRLARIAQEKKREVIAQAANEMSPAEFRKKFGEMAYVAAIARATMEKAMSSSDPKQTEAARFLFKETGLSAGVDEATEKSSDSVLASLGAEMVEYMVKRAKERDNGI